MQIEGQGICVPGVASETQNESRTFRRWHRRRKVQAGKLFAGDNVQGEPLGSNWQFHSATHCPSREQQPILRERHQNDDNQIERGDAGRDLHYQEHTLI